MSSVIDVGSFVQAHLDRRPKSRLAPELSGLRATNKMRAIVRRCGAKVIEGGSQPCYVYDEDIIIVPSPWFYWWRRIALLQATYSICLAHELCHWAQVRLNRPKHVEVFDDTYRKLEVEAELGSAVLIFEAGISTRACLPNARYIASYVNSFPNPELELRLALSRASEVAGYILRLSQSRNALAA